MPPFKFRPGCRSKTEGEIGTNALRIALADLTIGYVRALYLAQRAANFTVETA
jgi:hypothetical protein